MPSVQDIELQFNPLNIITQYIMDLSEETGRNVIIYYSGFLNNPSMGCEICDRDVHGLMAIID